MSKQTGVTEKIDRAETGFKAAIYVHAYLNDAGELDEIRFSEPKKEDNGLEKLLDALGNHVTHIIRDYNRAKQ